MTNPAHTAIIIPCFNEAFRLKPEDFTEFIDTNEAYDLVFVDDGSSDDTFKKISEISELRPGNIQAIKLDTNKGKAEAVRFGINKILSQGKYNFVSFFDADLATPLEEIQWLMSHMKANEEISFCFGSRFKSLNANIERNTFRHFSGRIIATFISGILKLKVYDTQCGAKLFKSELADQIFHEAFISKWLFDVELLARASRIYGRNNINSYLKEVPLNTWIEQGDSKVKWTYMFKLPFDLMNIWWKYR